MKKTKPRTIIQGANEKVWWDSLIEAMIWSKCYNIWHSIKRDGKCITCIWYKDKTICV